MRGIRPRTLSRQNKVYSKCNFEVDPQLLSPLVGSRLADFLPHNLNEKLSLNFTLSLILKSNLPKHGFTEPTPVQALAIEPALAGRNLVATAQTGTGKTLAFVLPLDPPAREAEPKTKGVRAVVLSPTRELAIQIHEVFAKMADGTGIRAAVVVGGLGENPQLQAIRKGAQVVIATPGRLYDFLSRKLVNLGAVRILVLDEADRMLDMGFLPTIKRIMAAMPAERQTLFFSATIETSVKHLVEAHVPNAVRIEVGSTTKPVEAGGPAPLRSRAESQARPAAKACCDEEPGSFLVFARTKHGADRLAKQAVSRAASKPPPSTATAARTSATRR